MCPEKQQKPFQAGVRALFHSERRHAVPFSPQDFCSPCEFVHRSHSTQTPRAGVRISLGLVINEHEHGMLIISMNQSLQLSHDRDEQEITLCCFKPRRSGVERYRGITQSIMTGPLNISALTDNEHTFIRLLTIRASFFVNFLFISLHISFLSSRNSTTHLSRLNLIHIVVSGRIMKSV